MREQTNAYISMCIYWWQRKWEEYQLYKGSTCQPLKLIESLQGCPVTLKMDKSTLTSPHFPRFFMVNTIAHEWKTSSLPTCHLAAEGLAQCSKLPHAPHKKSRHPKFVKLTELNRLTPSGHHQMGSESPVTSTATLLSFKEIFLVPRSTYGQEVK